MIDKDIVEKLSVTRARLEAAASGSTVIAVTSAQLTDGVDLLAHGLAMSLASVNRDVLLLAPANARGRAMERSSLRDGRDAAPTIANLASAYSLETARIAFETYRRDHTFTVVSAAGPLQDGSMLSLIGAADFVLISVEEGRAGRAEDRELADALRASKTNVLGVVTIDRRSIRAYAANGSTADVRELRRADVSYAVRFEREDAALPASRTSLIS